MKTIFFSWQVDTPPSTGRNFIRGVLEEVCKELAEDTNVSEAMRDLSVDSDTRDVAGQPPIVSTILKKIDISSIFVGDMTFVGKRMDTRPTPNPNVLIEYGWALKSKGHELTILVMNTAYGEPSDTNLPFNMRHYRWPLRYHLPENATPNEKAKVKTKLKIMLTDAVRASLSTLPPPVIVPPPAFPMAETRDPPARFRAKNESLGFAESMLSDEEKEVFLQYGAAMWLRVMPMTETGKRWNIPELKRALKQRAGDLPPMIRGDGWDILHAVDGVGAFGHKTPPQRDDKSPAIVSDRVAYIFETGEIWSIDTALLGYHSDWIYAGDVEKAFSGTLRHYSDFLQSMGLKPPFRWIAGMHGLKGRKLSYAGDRTIRERNPKCLTDSVIVEGTYDGTQDPEQTMFPFFREIFLKCGIERP